MSGQPLAPVPEGPGQHQPPAAEERQCRKCLQETDAAGQRRAAAEYQRGLADGEAVGVRKSARRLDAELERLARSLADLACFRDRFRRESEQDLVNVALAIARRILRRELSVDPEAVLGLVKVGIEKVSLREVHSVRLHPDDVPVVKSHLELIQAPLIEISSRDVRRRVALKRSIRFLVPRAVECYILEKKLYLGE